MNKNDDLSATICIDLNRNRIRLHRATLKKMGDPKYIQFLINPEEMYLAVLGTNKPVKGGTANRVQALHVNTQKNIEFCSTAFLEELLSKIGSLDRRYSYHLTGEVDSQNRVAYYSFQTLKKLERDI